MTFEASQRQCSHPFAGNIKSISVHIPSCTASGTELLFKECGVRVIPRLNLAAIGGRVLQPRDGAGALLGPGVLTAAIADDEPEGGRGAVRGARARRRRPPDVSLQPRATAGVEIGCIES